MAHPDCISINLCDYVVEDKRTNNKSLIGLFNQIYAPTFPCIHPNMFVVAALTDIRGEQKIRLEITRDTSEGEKTLVGIGGMIRTESPLDVTDLVFHLQGFPLEAEGRYNVYVKMEDGAILGQRHFNAHTVPSSGES